MATRCFVIATCCVEGSYYRAGEEIEVQKVPEGFADVYLRVMETDPAPEKKANPKPKRKAKE